jgi:phosphoribosylamine--glycine ligase
LLRVLVVGNGGRENVLVWKLSQSQKVKEIFCIPGNAGISDFAQCVRLEDESVQGIAKFAQEKGIDLTVVGPEAYLVQGIVDEFESRGLRIFGPQADAAQIEGSKIFAKSLMDKYNIPTAQYGLFTELEKAKEYVKGAGFPVVIKANGLAAGKGVKVVYTPDEAFLALENMMLKGEFGTSGEKVVIEEFLQGEEATILAFTDGHCVVPMVPSQDHKAVFDNDKGPNTGGMGAYSPAPVVTDEVYRQVYEEILCPVIDALRQEGVEYKGVLYAGLMIKDGKAKVVEFNCRFGDPEAQVVLPRLETDLVDIFNAVIDGRLEDISIKWKDEVTVCVIMASGGYPNQYEKGFPISGLDFVKDMEDLWVFHAGTAKKNGEIVTNGGRVLAVTAMGDTIREAVDKAYEGVRCISFEGAHYRKDIGAKAFKHV